MKALIFGRAQGVWDEIEEALSLSDFDRVCGVGSVGCDYPGSMSDWVTYHGNMFYKWLADRQRNKHPAPMWSWSSSRGRRISEVERRLGVRSIDSVGGSSSKIAFDAMVSEGATKIVLCGVPMTIDGRQYDTGRLWNEALMFRQPWRDIKDKSILRSMSGWTMEEFGKPTKDWLDACCI